MSGYDSGSQPLRTGNLQEEDTNFYKVLNVLGKRAKSQGSKDYLKQLRGLVKEALERNEVNLVLVTGQEKVTLPPERVLKDWLYGYYWHSDEEKRASLEAWKAWPVFHKYVFLSTITTSFEPMPPRGTPCVGSCENQSSEEAREKGPALVLVPNRIETAPKPTGREARGEYACHEYGDARRLEKAIVFLDSFHGEEIPFRGPVLPLWRWSNRALTHTCVQTLRSRGPSCARRKRPASAG